MLVFNKCSQHNLQNIFKFELFLFILPSKLLYLSSLEAFSAILPLQYILST